MLALTPFVLLPSLLSLHPLPSSRPLPFGTTESLVRAGCVEPQLPAHLGRVPAAVLGDPDPGRHGALALRGHGLQVRRGGGARRARGF